MSDETVFQPQWSRRAAQASGVAFGGGEPAALSLRFGVPDTASFPAARLAEATNRVLGEPAQAALALQYGRIQGYANLAHMLAGKLELEEGLKAQASDFLITNGSSGAIGLAARLMVDEGDTVLVEGPSFPGAMSIFRRTGAELRQIRVGSEGLDIASADTVLESLAAEGIQPRVLYVMPTFHNPTGLTLSLEQRRNLLDFARRFNLVIIEDDAYRDLYYDAAAGPLPPSLYALDTDGRVIRTGTFSKILSPGMRLGWALARPDMIGKMMLLKDEGGTSPFAQYIAVEYGKNGVLMEHITRLVEIYRSRRDAMLAALERHFPSEASWTRPAGGFFVWVMLPTSVDPTMLARLAHEEGVDYLPGENCFVEPPRDATYLRLSFSSLTEDQIEEAVKRLSKAVRSIS